MVLYAIKGDFIWTEDPSSFKYSADSYLIVQDGRFLKFSSSCPDCPILDYSGHLIIPGLSDLHLHAPQYAFMGLYMDDELLKWLDEHTFPEEAKYRDLSYAEKAYSIFVSDLLKTPTSRLSVFGTIHTDATLMLINKLESAGFSGYCGKVNMDRNSPPFLTESTSESIEETYRYLESCRTVNMKPIVTPRFIPSCSDELLSELGRIAVKYDLPVQSHLDENLSEIEWVKSLMPEAESYTDAYLRMGLIGKTHSIMAHAVWVTDDEIPILRNSGTFIAHSPSSNYNLSSGIAPVRKLLSEGVNTGLGTDVAGGSSLSILSVVRDAIAVSKLRWRLVDDSFKPLTLSEAFYMASKGGGSFFGKTGSFEEGYDADFSVLDESDIATPLSVSLSLPERLEIYISRSSEKAVKAKSIKGKIVHCSHQKE